jgi:glutathione S-transferase
VAFGIPMQPQLLGYYERVAERPMVRKALAEEGLPIPAGAGVAAPTLEIITTV